MWAWQFLKDAFEKLTQCWGGLEARLEHGLSSQECSRAPAQPHLDVVSNFLQLKFQEVGSSSSKKNHGVGHSFSLGIPFPMKQCPAEGKAALQQGRILPKAQQHQQLLPAHPLSFSLINSQVSPAVSPISFRFHLYPCTK